MKACLSGRRSKIDGRYYTDVSLAGLKKQSNGEVIRALPGWSIRFGGAGEVSVASGAFTCPGNVDSKQE